MSDKSFKTNNTTRVVKYYPNVTPKSPFITDLTKDFDCLKISILNKASRVSGEFNKVTIGPHACSENGYISDTVNEDETKSNKASLNGSLSNRSNITFSIKKILLENELQRREKVKKVVEKKKLEMEKLQKRMQNELSDLLSKLSIQREKDTAEKLARLEAEEEQLAQQLEIDRKNEVKKQRLRESEELLKKLIPYRESFHAKWKDIDNISKSCYDKNSASQILGAHAARLKELDVQMELINEKAGAGDLTAADVKMAEILVQCNEEVFQLFKADIEKFDCAYEQEIARREMEVQKAKLEAERSLLAKQAQDAQNNAAISEQIVTAPPIQQEITEEQPQQKQTLNFQVQQISEVDSATAVSQPAVESTSVIVSAAACPPNENQSENLTQKTSNMVYPDSESWQLFINSHKFLDSYTASYQNFVKSDAMKKFKFECQKTLNITINSISHTSSQQLVIKYEKLKQFLLGKVSPNILLNPQAEAYSKSLLAQKIVDQGDTTISSKPELAFPFAAIVVALWNDWPDFGALLLARFHCRSPFFVPVFLMPRADQSEQDYYKSLGCKYNENGLPEKPEQFWKKLSGLMYLYASILITRQRRGVAKPHPHGLGNAWRWLAATLNIEPRSDLADICATLIYTILEVTGHDLWRTYPHQFPKMLLLLKNVYYEKLKSFDPVLSAPISRLGDFLETALKKGTIPPPKGHLPDNFW